jgi:hypothetical protein
MAAWEIWEKALIASLLNASGTWCGICHDRVNLCDDLQNFFWRVMLGVLESCLKIALQSETQMLGMKWRIWQEIFLLLVRIKKHDVNTLCRQKYEEGRKHDWPGLGQEVAEICNVLGIPDVNVEEISKSEVAEAIFENHYKEMMEIIKSKSKLNAIHGEKKSARLLKS